jgi:hypothetical protein
MPTDFRDGKTFPRRGRDTAGDAMWLYRVFDKARAAADGTIFDYIYPCPMDKGVFDRWGVSATQFERAIREHSDDDAILAWLKATVPSDKVRAANDWLTSEKIENLDRQDREETGSE